MTESGRFKWVFEEATGAVEASGMLLVRITIAKVARRELLMSILRGVPVKQGEPGWNCVAWVREALDEIRAHAELLGTSRIEWQDVRDTAMWYVEKKKSEHRFDGQGDFDIKRIATYDSIDRQETVP